MTEGSSNRVLVTGAGSGMAAALINDLLAAGRAVTGASRAAGRRLPPGVRHVATGEINRSTDWSDALRDARTVVHCAGLTRLHPGESDRAFDVVNHQGTVALAEQSSASGVQRLVYISSASIVGRRSDSQPLDASSPPIITSLYSRSKFDAEQALFRIAATTGLEIVIVRPPRVVGTKLTGHLAVLARLIAHGLPLPFGALTQNRRDNVSLVNLSSLIELALTEPGAKGAIWYATDDDPISTRTMIARIAALEGCSARQVGVPELALRAMVTAMPRRLLGNLDSRAMLSELVDSYELDVAPQKRLGWRSRQRTFVTG